MIQRLLQGMQLAVLLALLGACSSAPPPAPAHATTSLREMMLRIVQPNSDAVFYISRSPPENDEQWLALEAQTLVLAESANLLMLPGYSRDQQQWMVGSQLMRTAAQKAYEAARGRNLSALEELNGELYESCESCHTAYR